MENELMKVTVDENKRLKIELLSGGMSNGQMIEVAFKLLYGCKNEFDKVAIFENKTIPSFVDFVNTLAQSIKITGGVK